MLSGTQTAFQVDRTYVLLHGVKLSEVHDDSNSNIDLFPTILQYLSYYLAILRILCVNCIDVVAPA